ncbi:DUF3775 domain-containing protein [Dongia sedimenti]|uniref:DUF3775 domain-containing protein n=1 Tax=Dongia sedimenti TaxID=3064282 RepID=A0ABU0YW61_9PROT|nr:DUF3775 domain-containing protein [Rhodospirillaceae bacterium R-7]
MSAKNRSDESEDPIELAVDPETVCFLIVKAREFDVKVDPQDDDPVSGTDEDEDIDVLEDRRDDPTYAELMGTLEALNEDELSDLVAMTWIGRGDFDRDDWEDAKEQARQRGSKGTAEYLLGTPLLGDYLESGFNDLGYSCEDVDDERL